MTLQVMAWLAICILAISHWLQVYKIHKHREVRDISQWTYVFLLTGYICLFIKAILDWKAGTGDFVWAARQMATIIPVTIVLFQIKWHQNDHWHDDNDVNCASCRNELEDYWCHCPYCGSARPCSQSHGENHNKQGE
jgi:uncharacterized protein with PQ loop repeat